MTYSRTTDQSEKVAMFPFPLPPGVMYYWHLLGKTELQLGIWQRKRELTVPRGTAVVRSSLPAQRRT